ncbi:GNAT family N-acetyltransferase [Apilactobacillus quenuiae]|uniref:GNAT family N-acetyltransferase n=1 Tax=Apilactobacillus quenuiae TaxID=2008377 RepID=UPI000D0138CA|nr:GNAT family N-acetyltransferase [Apilactobacillus quenuiae]
MSFKIRALERTDLTNVHQLMNDPFNMQFWFKEPYLQKEKLDEKFDKLINDHAVRSFAITYNDNFAGIVELVDVDLRHRHAEIQIIVDDEFRGLKLAQKSFKACLDYAFSTLNLHKVYLYVDVDNAPAVNVYKKIGFQIEGKLKEQYFENNKYHDCYFMSIFKNNYFK